MVEIFLNHKKSFIGVCHYSMYDNGIIRLCKVETELETSLLIGRVNGSNP